MAGPSCCSLPPSPLRGPLALQCLTPLLVMNSARGPAYLRAATLLCSLPFFKEESRCLISVSCISLFLQSTLTCSCYFCWNQGWGNVHGTEGGLISTAGANPSQISVTRARQPHREGLFSARWQCCVGWSCLARREVLAAEHWYTAPAAHEQSWQSRGWN